MEIKLDTKADALYIRVKKGKVFKTITQDEALLDVDEKGDLLGIEILNYSKVVLGSVERIPLPA
jgi:uncharacterized protein YuzE